MKKQKEKLIRVRNYAEQNNKSIAWAYKQVKSGAVKTKVIDGMTFIVVND